MRFLLTRCSALRLLVLRRSRKTLSVAGNGRLFGWIRYWTYKSAETPIKSKCIISSRNFHRHFSTFETVSENLCRQRARMTHWGRRCLMAYGIRPEKLSLSFIDASPQCTPSKAYDSNILYVSQGRGCRSWSGVKYPRYMQIAEPNQMQKKWRNLHFSWREEKKSINLKHIALHHKWVLPFRIE